MQQGEAHALPPALAERVRAGSLADIEAWFDRAIDADSVDAVFQQNLPGQTPQR